MGGGVWGVAPPSPDNRRDGLQLARDAVMNQGGLVTSPGVAEMAPRVSGDDDTTKDWNVDKWISRTSSVSLKPSSRWEEGASPDISI